MQHIYPYQRTNTTGLAEYNPYTSEYYCNSRQQTLILRHSD